MSKVVVTGNFVYLLKRANGVTIQDDGEVTKGEILDVLESKSKYPAYLRVRRANGVTGYVNKRDVRPCQNK